MSATSALLDDYLATILAWDAAHAEPTRANRLFRHMHALQKQLREKPDGRAGI